jgi:hypothetical protein
MASKAFNEGFNSRSKKQKKRNPYVHGSENFNEFEAGWAAHLASKSGKNVTVNVTINNPAPAPTKKPKTYVGFCLDRSGSMYGLRNAVIKAYNSQAEVIRNRAIDQDIRVSTNSFGGNIQSHLSNRSASELRDLTSYEYAPNGQTPLFDAVGAMIEDFQGVADAGQKDVAFMVLVVTDGYENASTRFTGHRIAQMISNLQSTDRWTFAFLVPPGSKYNFARQFGIPEANIREWEQTERGVQEFAAVTNTSFDSYFQSRSLGVTSSKAFYTDLSGVKSSTIKAKLRDVSKEILTFTVNNRGAEIRPFVEKAIGGPMLKGAAFYQLMKTEKNVQDYKQIIIRDKKTGAVYSGAEARNLLGLPHNGNVKIIPGNHGAYDVFVQSTSVNRKLPVGTQVIYWSKVGQAFTEGPSARR